LGIAFQYEMRGLWELTRVSRQPAFAGSQAFRQGLQLEALVARNADRLFVISEQLGHYARAHWGLDPERMALLPNCVDADRFVPADPREIEADTIGYAGSLMGYEGLDTLVDAVEMLARQGSPVKVRLIGEGEAGAGLRAMAERPGVSGRIDFSGRMSPEEARKALCRCALVCIPRKPFEVCRIVPPIKLVEALAMAKPVIVPDLPVFRDEMGANPAGWFFEAGNAADLARVIGQALSDRARLAALGERARAHALKERRWRDFVTHVLPARQGEK
jgi:glycosyltransferase involved in cell wall biosynthesis